MKKAKSPKTKDVDWPKYEAIGAHMISQEVAISCFLEIFSKTNPTTAKAVSQLMKKACSKIPDAQYPGVNKRVQQYIELIESNLGPVSH